MTKTVMVITPNRSRRTKRSAAHSRVCIPEDKYKAEVAAAKKEGRPCLYVLDKQQDDPPCFDGLTKPQQKKVLERQAARAKAIEAAKAEAAQ